MHGKQPAKFTEIGYAGKGFEAHHEMNRALHLTMSKDRAPNSASHMSIKTTSRGGLGSLEHYIHAWNAADLGVRDG